MNLDDDELRATKSVRQAYDTVYAEMCRYIDLYNESEQELEYHKKLLIHIIDDILFNMGLEINEKNEARTIQTYKDNLRKVENKVTEKELKDMILGMLE